MKKYKFEFTEAEIIQAVRDSCKYQINNRDLKEATVKAIGIELKEIDLEKWLNKASEKAIKDIAKWKLMQDYISARMEVDDLTRKVDAMIENFNNVMKEVQEYKDIMKHLKEQSELIKS